MGKQVTPARRLPRGSVTFLFTDIEGSTRLLHELGQDAYADALADHRRLLRQALAAHGGVEIDTQGDAFFYAFEGAADAAAAAEAAQEALAGGPIRVRLGLHTGEPLVTPQGYVGLDVHKGARIAAAGHGGQVLLSATTRALVEADLLDLGEHRLKDFSEPVWIYQLGGERFPPLKTISNTNLPRPASSFVGRERELSEIVAALSDGARLVTLLGPGGSGKTRLAIEAAAELVPEFGNGVFWVGLATVRDSLLVVQTIAQTLGATQDLASHVGQRELLLLLDNFEQVMEAAPELSALLERCPNLRLMVTSRELLRIRGELRYAVPPLAEPEAVQLFCERSGLEAGGTIAELCRRLDNLPLAVELAAARTSILSPQQMLERLAQRLDLLRGGRDAEARQQTLRATIGWSYELLGEEEQRLFANLSVFAGGCTLDAAEQVAGADLDKLQSLVEKSLVRHTKERFWMLETIREYALGCLQGTGEAEETRRRHAELFLALAESANLCVERIEEGQRHELLIPEADNLRAALDWALASGDISLGTSLAVALEQFWVVSSPREGARRLRELLARGASLSPALRARGLRALGGATYIAGDFEEGTRWHEAALDAYRALGDSWAIAHMLFRFAVEADRTGDQDKAKALCEESLGLYRSKSGDAEVFSLLGKLAFEEGRHEEALDLLRRSAALAAECGFRWWQIHALQMLAEYALTLGRLEGARPAAREGLRIAHAIGDRQSTVYGLAVLAWMDAAAGDSGRAGRLWGAIEGEAERAPIGQWEAERDDYAERVSSAAGPDFEQGRAAGRRLLLDEAVSEVLDSMD